MRCNKGAMKRRISKPHGNHSHGDTLNPYQHSLKGHTWNKHGTERTCINCGCKPRGNR